MLWLLGALAMIACAWVLSKRKKAAQADQRRQRRYLWELKQQEIGQQPIAQVGRS